MKISDDIVLFESTGRKIYANRGIIGLAPDGDITEGYDGNFNDYEELAPAERAELADYMIERWTAFKSKSGG